MAMSHPTHCPGCGNQCPLDAPSCTTGENYARSLRSRRSKSITVSERTRSSSAAKVSLPSAPSQISEQPISVPKKKRAQTKRNSAEKSAELTPAVLQLTLEERLSLAFHGAERALDQNKPEERSGQSRLLILLHNKGPLTQRELAVRMGIRSSSLSELLQKLEKCSLVERQICPTDHRTTLVQLTGQGAEKAAGFPTSNHPFQKLTAEEQQQLLMLLEKLQ